MTQRSVERMHASCRWGGALVLGVSAWFAPLQAATLAPLNDVAQIVAGQTHTCVLDRFGKVSCWGDNTFGQLGLGEDTALSARPTPVPVPGLEGIRTLGTGYAHTCAITNERGVVCWGFNDSGQLGAGDTNYSRNSPVATLGLTGPVSAVVTGSRHSCALLQDGRVSCWGNNERGQLGDGSSVGFRPTASLVVGLPATALQIAAGDEYTCAALADGSMRCWGANGVGQLGNNSTTASAVPVSVIGLPGPVTAMAGSALATCALSSGGALYCWGSQFPLGAFAGGSLTARLYPGFESGFTAVDAGDFHFCALATTGKVHCLGDNIDGQFGTGPLDGSANAQTTIDLAPDVTKITAGGHHTCASASSGRAQCWGSNRAGQLGIDIISLRLVPTAVSGQSSGVAAVTVGERHSCSLSSGGAVKCWGVNLNGELGDGSTLSRLTPVDVIGLQSGVRAIAAGAASTCAITGNRRVKCWGANFDGRLGNGENQNSAMPVDVLGLGDTDVLAISIGRAHTCALLSGGAVRCWGDNEFGQLGDGSETDRPLAVPVSGLSSGVRAISAGFYHTCAVTEAGAMRCWGINESGQLGDDSNTNRNTPVNVAGLSSGVNQPAAGALHTCALLNSGGVSCWGGAFFGLLLGDGSTTDRRVPGEVPSLRSGVVELSAGNFKTCVRSAVGAVQCWGNGVGDNTQIGRSLPTDVAGLTGGVLAIDAGVGEHACASVGGAARCWGDNTFGQIGDGTTHGETSAKTVLNDELVRQVASIAETANAASSAARFDASGRYVLFQSDANNLVSGDSNAATDVFLQDRDSGQITRISVDNTGAQINGAATEASLSADATLAVFVAPDVAVGKLLGESALKRQLRHKGGSNGIFMRNMLAGSTQRIGTSMASGSAPALAPGGGSVVFSAPVTDPTQGEVGQVNLFVVPLTRTGNTITPGPTSCISCKSVDAVGASTFGNVNGNSGNGVLSADGRWLVYQTTASNALTASPAPCPAGNSQIMLRNMLSGATSRVSPPNSLPSASCGTSGSQNPSMDFSGQTIAWESDQPLTAGDANGLSDVFVWQSSQPTITRASVGGNGADSAGSAKSPQISGDGRQLVFVSNAPNHDLSFPDNNERDDVHSVALADLPSIKRLSRTTIGGEINAASTAPALNFDGTTLAFQSTASNLGVSLAGGSSVFARSNPQATAKRTATWWIPSESGWGLTVFDQGNVLIPGWFTYDVDGEPTWFFINGAFPQADGSFRGSLLRLRGTPFNQINGPAIQTTTTVGEVNLRFSGESRLDFAYAIDGVSQSKTLEKFPFGARNFTCSTSPGGSRVDATNYTDLWSGAGDNAGWGLTILHVDNLIFAGWYTYDSDGEAVFFILSGSQQTDGSFAGNVSRQRNGTPFSMINGNLASPGSDVIGSMRLVFVDGQTANFSYTIGSINQTRSINRLLVGSEGQQCRSVNVGGN